MSFERRKGAGWAVHPGEILNEEFLKPMGISGYRLVQGDRRELPNGKRYCAAQARHQGRHCFAPRRFFGMSSEFWTNLQSSYELARARTAVGGKLARIRPHNEAA